MKKVVYITLPLILFLTGISFALAQGYEPLQPLPGLPKNPDLTGVLSGLIDIIIGIGVLLGVVLLGYAGFQYMGSDIVTQKSEAKGWIQAVVYGLLILFGSWLLLNIINPNILNLNFLQGTNSLQRTQMSPQQQTQQQSAVRNARVAQIANSSWEEAETRAEEYIRENCKNPNAPRTSCGWPFTGGPPIDLADIIASGSICMQRIALEAQEPGLSGIFGSYNRVVGIACEKK